LSLQSPSIPERTGSERTPAEHRRRDPQATFTYDANGNQTDGLGRHIDYASYNKPARITQGALSLTFADDVDHQRFQLSTYNGSTLASTTTYFDAFGVHAELFTAATTQWTDYLMVAGSMVGMRVLHADQSVQVRYFHQDHLGSIAAVSDESGASAVERNAYDPWGREQSSSGTASQTIRGYTGQELLASVGLVHLNGRVYDPVIGRMMSADPVVGDPLNGQTWNRYSYVNNNPLAYTDPTGYCAVCGVVDSAGTFLRHSFGWIKRTLLRNPIIGSLYVIASATACGPLGPVCAAVATAEVAGITTGDFGLALRAGAIAGATALAFYGVGEITSGMPGAIPIDGTHGTFIPFSEGHIANIVGHALLGCGSAVASGGKCGPGALAGGITSAAGPFLQDLQFQARVVIGSTLGGVASVAGGGKFSNGAVTGAFGYLFNEIAYRGFSAQIPEWMRQSVNWIAGQDLLPNNGGIVGIAVSWPGFTGGNLDLGVFAQVTLPGAELSWGTGFYGYQTGGGAGSVQDMQGPGAQVSVTAGGKNVSVNVNGSGEQPSLAGSTISYGSGGGLQVQVAPTYTSTLTLRDIYDYFRSNLSNR
jgi:RHS repeat-associated protein